MKVLNLYVYQNVLHLWVYKIHKLKFKNMIKILMRHSVINIIQTLMKMFKLDHLYKNIKILQEIIL